jgi:hypothetical protein
MSLNMIFCRTPARREAGYFANMALNPDTQNAAHFAVRLAQRIKGVSFAIISTG